MLSAKRSGMGYLVVLGACLVSFNAQAGLFGGGAKKAPSHTIQTYKPGDSKMSCGELEKEISEMDTIMSEAESAARNTENTAAVTGTATGVAAHAAGLGGLPFVGAIANAASGLGQQQASLSAAEQRERADQAEKRRIALMGIYHGKNCETVETESPEDEE